MKIWITGIAGFLGSHLAERLIGLGHEVYGNDNMLCASQPLTKDYLFLNCCDFAGSYARGWTPFENYDCVIHCAATAHEGLSNFSPSFITKNIYEASVATFSAAIEAGVKRIIFMSSMARYGVGEDGRGPPFRETDDPMPVDPYGIAKIAAEDTLMHLGKLHGVEYVIAVPHNIIGPRQKYDDPFRNVASIMINRALQGKPILVYGDGNQMRSFSPINDCLDSLVKMIDAPVAGEVINIGPSGQEMTVNKLAELVKELTGADVPIEHIPARPNEVKEAWCSNEKAVRLLDYKPRGDIRSCLAEMIAFIRTNGTKPFVYNFPIEIRNKCPEVWMQKQI